jgi:hypothetical protein
VEEKDVQEYVKDLRAILPNAGRSVSNRDKVEMGNSG